MGGIPHFFRHVSVPIYGSPFTVAMIKAKLESHEVKTPSLIAIEDNQSYETVSYTHLTLPTKA